MLRPANRLHGVLIAAVDGDIGTVTRGAER